ncbi:Acyl-coenzyme A synthetase ACSM3, mitochondrial [Aix galericulata]|nr:Acyl-coenzyme A synthetase ACSM3, mitochondrial [Aix galericulata]
MARNVLIPGTQQLTAKDILYRLQKSKAKCIITDDFVAPAVDSVGAECQSLKCKLLVSEGHREGWLNFKDLLKNAPSNHQCVTTKHHDPMAIYFTSGTTGSPKMTEHSHSSYGIGLTVNASYTFKSLRHCVSAGEPINPDVMEEWKVQTGLDIHEGYGQTETIIDENGNILSPGKEGDIAIRVVKAFVVLTPDYVSRDPEEVMKELQDHVKKVTAPYKYPRKVSTRSSKRQF